MTLTRRRAVQVLIVTAVAGTVGASVYQSRALPEGGMQMTPPEALAALRAGSVVLIDIRSPEEWAMTGLAEGAVPIDMRRPDFVEAVRDILGPQDRRVALICARGVRSRQMTRLLLEAGIAPIIDVPEGMLGSPAGPGWVKRDLPVVTWTGEGRST